jgi:PHP family Zn ribbon phosphoesterase
MSSPTYYTCNACGFFTKGNFSKIAYNLNEKGEREFVPHARSGPFDGYMHQTVCLECLNQFKLDHKADELKCPACASANIVHTHETKDKPCPKCKEGIIVFEVDESFII